MPEGPEVRRMAEGLAKRIVGKELVEAEILGGKWLKKEPTGISLIREALSTGPIQVDWVNYTDMDNNHGDFVFSFHVYRKESDPLGNNVIHEITPDGRMTHWVPEIQK